MRSLKAQHAGELGLSDPELERNLADLGFTDEFRLHIHPVVLAGGKPLFAGPRPPLRLTSSNRIGDEAIKLTCVPA